MNYNKTNWSDRTTILSAENLNKIEQALFDLAELEVEDASDITGVIAGLASMQSSFDSLSALVLDSSWYTEYASVDEAHVSLGPEDAALALSYKVDKVDGKGLSTNDYTTEDMNKLRGLTTTAQDNLIEEIRVNGVATDIVDKIVNIRVPMRTSDLLNDSGFLILHQDISSKLDVSLKGEANGLAELNAEGKVPQEQLPEVESGVIEVSTLSALPANGTHDKIYITLDTNKIYRCDSGTYIEISSQLSLGNTEATAYRGDRGKIAYDHSQVAHAPSNAKDNIIETIQVNGVNKTPSSKTVNIVVPTKTSDLSNDSGFITSHQNISGKEDTSNKTSSWGDNPSNTKYPTEKLVKDSLDGKLDASLQGSVNGLAQLDSTGKVPAYQLPAFVDDIIDVASYENLPSTGESGKIYVAYDTNKTYRWGGSSYVEISSSLALGETSSTAYGGDRGALAYTHSVTPHAPTNAERNTIVGLQVNNVDLYINSTTRKANIVVDTMPTASSSNLITSGAVKSYVDTAIANAISTALGGSY